MPAVHNMVPNIILAAILLSLNIAIPSLSYSFPLSTNSRWIVEARTGNRMKLACVNWAGHLHTMIPEGLNKKPMTTIASEISAMAFNCVRLTYATWMFTRSANKYGNVLTVSQALERWNLTAAKHGVTKNNRRILNMTIWDAQKSVIDALGAQNVMVILDNHVSKPIWCCSLDDGNGFFGDQYFDPAEWVRGLVHVAKRYKGNPVVVGMSLRNELRGERSNSTEWLMYMQEGATAVHKANPHLLVILGGMKFATDLSFLKAQPLTIMNLNNKLVLEAHWYAFGQSLDSWKHKTNAFCANTTKVFMNNNGFLFTSSSQKKNTSAVLQLPLFLSEYGADQRGTNEVDDLYLNCLLATVAEYDMDWALWHLDGSFMLRQGKMDFEDVYGMYDINWDKVRNTTYLERLRPIQMQTQDPKVGAPRSYLIYHPKTGKCIDGTSGTLIPTSCRIAKNVVYNKNGGSSPIQLMGSNLILKAMGLGLPPTAVTRGKSLGQQSLWTIASKSKKYLATKDEQGNNLCLEWDSNLARVVTNKCLCLNNDLIDVPWCSDNPQSQWFKLVPTTKK